MTTHLPDPFYSEIQTRKRELVAFLLGATTTRLPINPEGDDFRAVVEDLQLFAAKADAFVRAYGEYVNSNSSRSVDLDLFTDQLGKQIEDNALFEIEECAAEVDAESAELAEAV